MKTEVNKSKLMKRAWAIYKGVNPYSYSFSAALRRVWEVEKATLEYEAREARKAAIKAENSARVYSRLEIIALKQAEKLGATLK